ncbi:hypothetical protein XCR1_1060041 [Xenorhabdus cabanillasii JM26]|uniref:Uncharacterized protein n=1 Tax=Xenorhabdus cabanillasii JM26 TaxID=1427517 RepID=W1IPM8_9GAMM|nr:hypothetical protein XCR1_1060041 [Xenorhabdus cabanillasii JM26]
MSLVYQILNILWGSRLRINDDISEFRDLSLQYAFFSGKKRVFTKERKPEDKKTHHKNGGFQH